ncbi:16S rRNA (uracil(1498)-N(3))-methyltransferase [Clostridium massiliodielmoense]|uniref:16S rRNA (uracil(1498)-N(3))-methyltransferase n=1 Tax=Clostridium massiliodielmoense TaxID=1776385 RepID=UPI000A26FBD9|nr:16S rRNA (uracil(1498)-N(3))-methyltransferase [Clostridium massiliodielmoense]
MHKFFVSENNILSDMAIIEGEDVKHIYKVLRLKEGDRVNINNCNGKEFFGSIDYIDKSKVEVKLLEELEINNEPPIEVYLYQGLPKASKMDLIVQKCTELGIREITPVVTSRVSSSINDIKRESKKLDRWNRIAFEACKQNKRTLIPKVNDIINMDELIKEQLKEMDLIVVPYENAENYGIKQMIKNVKSEVKKVGIIIGPEGGFEQEEIEELKNIEAHIVTLGPRILRTETAGFTCLALLMYELGDLGGVS